MKHKHADLIHAWADGAQIQSRNSINEDWKDNRLPVWANDTMYRIKPEPKPDAIRTLLIEATLFHNEPFVQVFRSRGCVSPNLRLTFDGETGNLKSAEVL